MEILLPLATTVAVGGAVALATVCARLRADNITLSAQVDALIEEKHLLNVDRRQADRVFSSLRGSESASRWAMLEAEKRSAEYLLQLEEMIAERDAALKAEYALQAAIEEFLRELSAKAVIRKDYGRFGRFAARFKWGPMERPTITVE